MQDEGFGVRVVEELQRRYSFPENVQLLDGGTLGMALLNYLTGTEKLILIDAVSGGLPPGSFYEFKDEAVKAYFKDKVSMHELGIQDVLAAMDIMDQPVKEIIILGAQPAMIDIGLELTPVLSSVVDQAVNRAVDILKSWQVELTKSKE